MSDEAVELWGWLDPAHPDQLLGRPAVEDWLARRLGLDRLTPTPPVPLDPGKLRKSKLTERMRRSLSAIVGTERLTEEPAARAIRSLGQSYPDQVERRAGRIAHAADAVVCPESAEEIVSLLAAAGRNRFRITARGGGTSVVGGFDVGRVGPPWVVADLARMDRVLTLSKIDRTVTAEAGISLSALEAVLAPDWLTVGHYPQSFEGATLGGSIMAGGSGQRSDRYGRMSDNLVSARLATPAGLWSTENFRHAAAGPWLGGLVAGSEGLFGILTDATVRLHDMPEHIEDRAWLLPSFPAALNAARMLEQGGHMLAMLRISDESETAFLSEYRLARDGRAEPTFLERTMLRVKCAPSPACLVIAGYEGAKQATGRAFAQAARVFSRAGGVALGARPGQSWRKSRYEAPYLRESLMSRGLGVDTFETATAWSNLELLHAEVSRAIADAAAATLDGKGRAVVMCHLSHAYAEGACLYFTAIFPRGADALDQWRTIKRAAMKAIVASGGTVSHHHGLGADHAEWADSEKGAIGIKVLGAVAAALDPKGALATGARKALPTAE
jgi:alkyldihydroxyacetonephosphate synthase